MLAKVAVAEKALANVGRVPVYVDEETIGMLLTLVERKIGRKNAVLQQALKIGLGVMVAGHAPVRFDDEQPMDIRGELPAGLADAYRGAPSFEDRARDEERATTASLPKLDLPATFPAGGIFGAGTMGGPSGVGAIAVGNGSAARPLSAILGTGSDE